MADYYQILGVKRAASVAEIKSAYRRLARERHPDVNHGSERAAREFAMLALAYRTLSDPQERARYDAQHQRWDSHASFVHSDNVHARRMRMVTLQSRLDKTVDRWLEADRRETFALQQAVFPTVTLFVSTFFALVFKPRVWERLGNPGRVILVVLFLIGLWHLTSRLRACIERYTYRSQPILGSIMVEEEKSDKPFSRLTAYAFLFVGCITSLTAGLFVGEYIGHHILLNIPFFDHHIRPHLLFYPPIAVLIIDTMHTVASKIDS